MFCKKFAGFFIIKVLKEIKNPADNTQNIKCICIILKKKNEFKNDIDLSFYDFVFKLILIY